MIGHLRQAHAVTLICNGVPGSAAARALAAQWPDVKLVLVAPPAHTFARMAAKAVYESVWDFKDRFQELLPGLAGSLQNAFRRARNGGNAGSDGMVEIPDASAEMKQAVAREVVNGYDLIQVDFADCLSLIEVLPPDVPRVFVHHQIHYVFHERLFGDRLQQDSNLRLRFEALKARELGLLGRYDALVAFTDVDARILGGIPGGPAVHCSPFGIREPAPRPGAHEDGAFNGTVVYVGSEYHYPNLDAVNWFLDKVWTGVVKARPDLRFTIVGLWSPATVERIERYPNVRCLGFVPELEPVLWESIMVVPLWIGSGIRTKILQAMMEGAPVLSTSVGCEGIPARDGEAILIRDTPEGFTEALLRLAGSAEERALLSRNARRLAVEGFSSGAAGRIRETAYQTILEGWKAKRAQGVAAADAAGRVEETGGEWKVKNPASCTL